ncbi:MAG TPA: tripartite tricarboxylate transporter substrate binding protein [Alphaproteobacteria bacterium]|nr:tripartite tricarboxylate transporter substrate binding protein [Alphaproteobacteria bacterium]
MWPTRLSLSVPAIAAVLAVTLASPSRAETTYPDKAVRIIVPYGPGGVADVSTRMVAQKLSERLGQNFFIDNRPGAGLIVAARAALSFAHDGYTLFLSGNGGAISESLFKSLPYHLTTDFQEASGLSEFEMLLVTKAGSPLTSVAKVVETAKASPGKLNFGTIAPGSTQNLSAVLFTMVTGIKASVVTFRTTPELITALVRGDIDVGFDYYAALRPALDSGQLKVFAVSGDHPDPLLPAVPTVKDSGYPDYIVTSWNGLSVPAGVSKDVVGKINTTVNAVLQDPDLRKKMAQFGLEPMIGTPEQITARLKADIEKWRVVIEKAHIPKE